MRQLATLPTAGMECLLKLRFDGPHGCQNRTRLA